MSDADGSVWVVFNGEIYNFPELKAELQGYGHLFRTNSDTEVIIHGYKQWGNDVLHHLNGMFGLAVWDEKRRQLMLARDRVGIKLLYYKISAGQLKFGSEIRALLATEKCYTGNRPRLLESFSAVSIYTLPPHAVSRHQETGPGNSADR